MKIGEAGQKYSEQINSLWEKKLSLLKQQKKLNETTDKKEDLDAVTLELKNVETQYDMVAEFMEKLLVTKTGLHDAQVARQQGNAWAEASEDASKCIEIARRIAEGGKVPPSDVEKLINYSPQMYMQAINAAAMNEHKSNKEYESLWDDEKETTEQNPDIDAKIDNMELTIETTDISSD